jgi:hypothetical protein
VNPRRPSLRATLDQLIGDFADEVVRAARSAVLTQLADASPSPTPARTSRAPDARLRAPAPPPAPDPSARPRRRRALLVRRDESAQPEPKPARDASSSTPPAPIGGRADSTPAFSPFESIASEGKPVATPASRAPGSAGLRRRHVERLASPPGPVPDREAERRPAPTPPERPWTVNVAGADGAQREMALEEIITAYRSGVVTGETLVWKDGMSDWRMIREVAEIFNAVG